ncbi:MAG: SDR family oxidoreductase [Oscillospiraceae bacterium]|jgi:2-deoxy-D-gluconate 3-dehydrogenase|nr:SDR family oxidoreductase [Oscillospiraceae bacterium]
MSITDFSMEWFRLDGKTALITGGNKGLGLAYAAAFAKAGADVFVTFHNNPPDNARQLVEAEGRKFGAIRAELSIAADRKAAIAACVEQLGGLDILVNNAATNHFEAFLDFPDEKFEEVLQVNLNAVYYMAHEAAKVMAKRGGGKIINIGSALSYTADRNCPSYVTAKHGVIGITKAFASELAKYNIQCNAICPGFFITDVNAAVSGDTELYDKITSRIAAGSWGSPTDLMGAAVFLASKASDYITGADLNIDGGFATVL